MRTLREKYRMQLDMSDSTTVMMTTLAERMFDADMEMNEFLMSEVDEPTAEYVVEVLMQGGLLHPTMLMFPEPDEVEEDDLVNGELPFGVCSTMSLDESKSGKFSVVTVFERRMMVLVHELAHAVVETKGLKDTDAHGPVFFKVHDELNKLVRDVVEGTV